MSGEQGSFLLAHRSSLTARNSLLGQRPTTNSDPVRMESHHHILGDRMAKIAKTADRKKVMDTTKSTDCPKCGKPTRIVKRVKDRERDIPGGIYISCSACEFYEKL